MTFTLYIRILKAKLLCTHQVSDYNNSYIIIVPNIDRTFTVY